MRQRSTLADIERTRQALRQTLQRSTVVPSERLLCKEFGQSRTLIRRLLAELAQEGVIRRPRGQRAAVVQAGVNILLGDRGSFGDTLRLQGHVPETELLDFTEGWIAPADALMLALGPTTFVYRVTRLRFADSQPVGYEVSVIPRHILPLLTREAAAQASLTQLLIKAHGLPGRSLRHVEAVACEDQIARHLHVPTGSPCLHTRRISWTAGGAPAEYASGHYRGDFYTLSMRLLSEQRDSEDDPASGSKR